MTDAMAPRALFFYGTLCHIPLLEIVLGRPEAEIAIRPAKLADHSVTWVADEPFPMIRASHGDLAEGILVEQLNETDVARLRFYEGGFDYDLTPLDVQTAEGAARAEVFFPEPGVWTPGLPWSLDDWVAEWGLLSLNAAVEVMGHFGKTQAQEMARLLPFLRARGWARQMAQDSPPCDLRRAEPASSVTLDPLPSGRAGFFRFDEFRVSHPKYDGTQSAVLERAAFVAYDAALLLPYDPKNDLLMLIEQLRYGPLLRGDPYPWVLEPIAGLVDAGEPPMETARREAVEEAGLHLSDIRPMLQTYASPGYSTEFFHFFLGVCDLSAVQGGIGGLEAENEDIRSHVLPFQKAMALMDSGEINQAPLAMMLLWLARKRPELRA